MLHCLNTPGSLAGNCSDMTVLERQRIKLPQGNGFNCVFPSSSSSDSGSSLAEVVAQAHSIKFHMPPAGPEPSPASGPDLNSAISRTFSCPPTLVEAKANDSCLIKKESYKKRKSDKPHNPKVCVFDIMFQEKKEKAITFFELVKLNCFLFRLLQKMIVKTRGSKWILKMGNPISQGRSASRITKPPQKVKTGEPVQIVQIQRKMRIKS